MRILRTLRFRQEVHAACKRRRRGLEREDENEGVLDCCWDALVAAELSILWL